MGRLSWEVVLALVLAVTAALACAFTAPRYIATGAVLLPGGMVRMQYVDANPRAALAQAESFARSHADALLIDRPVIQRSEPWLPWAALAIALGLLAVRLCRRGRRIRSERELVAVLGDSLVAARPLAPRHLCGVLRKCWFDRGRAVLPVVSPEGDTGAIAVELAQAFAAAGEPTLLIDGDLRSPSVHRALGLKNRAGLADFLAGRAPRLHRQGELSVLLAGRADDDPLELLSRRRLQDLIAVAGRRHTVVIVATPPAQIGPDLQIFAALAGGALVVTRRPAQAYALERLREFLHVAKARVVGTVLAPA